MNLFIASAPVHNLEESSTRSIPALALAALLLLAAGASSGAAEESRRVVQASEILDAIERGEPVDYDGVIVEGDLDLSGLNLPTENVDRTKEEKQIGLPDERKVISSQLIITNSKIQGNVNFDNTHFVKLVNFRGAELGGYAYRAVAISPSTS